MTPTSAFHEIDRDVDPRTGSTRIYEECTTCGLIARVVTVSPTQDRTQELYSCECTEAHA